ncbi:MAG: MerR family transcriptional regulator [Nocardioidaceae bacterium]
MGDASGAAAAARPDELTVDELAARVGMTVRNVRAYAGRGLIPPPRLVGRTGYYGKEHAQRLRLVRELIGRGYTLSAVEKALSSSAPTAAGHALDLLEVLESPLQDAEPPEVITREGLAALAGIDRDDVLVDQLVEMGLASRLDAERLTLLRPSVVRAGARAIALGLQPDTVLALLPVLSDRLSTLARAFVHEVRTQVWHPFIEAGMPEEDWPRVLSVVQSLLPVASQATLAVFRNEMSAAVHDAMGQELVELSSRQPSS